MPKFDMYDKSYFQNEVLSLQRYYHNLGRMVIIGANDSLGCGALTTFFNKGLVQSVGKMLRADQLDSTLINCCSMNVNKTEHIDQMLTHNLNVAEITSSRLYGIQVALEKIFEDLGIKKFEDSFNNLDKESLIAKVLKHYYPIEVEDLSCHITDTLVAAKEPTFIYTCGVNNYMREVANNPCALGRDFKRKDITPNYNYSLAKIKSPSTYQEIHENIERNFDHILSINKSTDIYALGIYDPNLENKLDKEHFSEFKSGITQYNDQLHSACLKYGASYIDMEAIGKMYMAPFLDFHPTRKGYLLAARSIVDSMYQKKITMKATNHCSSQLSQQWTTDNLGLDGMIEDALTSRLQTLDNIHEQQLEGYPLTVQKRIVNEHSREAKIFLLSKQRVNY